MTPPPKLPRYHRLSALLVAREGRYARCACGWASDATSGPQAAVEAHAAHAIDAQAEDRRRAREQQARNAATARAVARMRGRWG